MTFFLLVFIATANFVCGFVCAVLLGKMQIDWSIIRFGARASASQHDLAESNSSRQDQLAPKVTHAAELHPDDGMADVEESTEHQSSDHSEGSPVAAPTINDDESAAQGVSDISSEVDPNANESVHTRPAPPSESRPTFDNELRSVEERLQYLRSHPDRNLAQCAAEQLSTALSNQVSDWTKEWEQASSLNENEQRIAQLEQCITQAESTNTNVSQIDWDDDFDTLLSKIETELGRLERATEVNI